MSALPAICILAGGLGTRLGDRARLVPKALTEVAGHPFLWHQLAQLQRAGARRVVLCVGHLGEQIEAAIGPDLFGLEIAYSYDSPGLDGTLGALRRAASMAGERFLVLYGDSFLRIDYADAASKWAASGCAAMMTVFQNRGRFGTSNARYANGRVLAYDKASPSADMAYIDYGLGGFEAAALTLVGPEEPDLSVLQHHLAAAGQLFGYVAHERFYEIGTPEALEETERFLAHEPRS